MPSTSQAQQGMMGMAHAVKSGKKKLEEIPAGARKKVQEIMKSMSDDDLTHFASTPRGGLPKRASGAPMRMRRTRSA